jgi:catechol 2,3-dioxygenase-like lactoylglutathione lyase family enzyme
MRRIAPFGARPPRRHDDDVLMLYNAAGFALALRPSAAPIARPSWMHFGIGLADRDAVLALRDQLLSDGVELVEEWDEPEHVSVKYRDPDGYIVEASWEPL